MQHFVDLRKCCCGKRLFVLEDNSCGLCPPETQPGNLVCLLYRGNAPFVLKKLESWDEEDCPYVLVEDCYVEGIMYGEAMIRSDLERSLSFVLGPLITLHESAEQSRPTRSQMRSCREKRRRGGSKLHPPSILSCDSHGAGVPQQLPFSNCCHLDNACRYFFDFVPVFF